ncbi:hypothetical protein [Klebsiella variicola]|uniref:hypothetical protein n=1 Tax=Klebsiella variicola TaxID=244366 RepID=UPI001CDA6F23|nr:hypothetical protein [Klebsiella variicola]
MYILIFKSSSTDIYHTGGHLLYDESTMMTNDISLSGALRVEVKSDSGGLLYAIDFPTYGDKKLIQETLDYGQEIDLNT